MRYQTELRKQRIALANARAMAQVSWHQDKVCIVTIHDTVTGITYKGRAMRSKGRSRNVTMTVAMNEAAHKYVAAQP